MRKRSLFALVVCLAVGCGGGTTGGDDDDTPGDPDSGPKPGDRNDAPAKLIPGGGVDDGPIAEVLHVYVIDKRTGSALSGATVKVGSLTGTTDAAGLASFDDPALIGKQTVSAMAGGHVAATWIGVGGANVTMALESSSAVPSAKASGNFQLPPPNSGTNDYTLGLVLSTFTPDLAAAENQLPQPTENKTALNIMIRIGLLVDDKSWALTTRVGAQRIYMLVLKGNTNGTNDDPADDPMEIASYSVGATINPSAGQMVMPTLTPVAGALTTFTASFPAAPAGLSEIQGFPVLDLGADGLMVIPLPALTPAKPTTKVPPNTGALAGTWGIQALASPPGTTTDVPFSSAYVKNVTGTATVPAWLAPPTGVSAKKDGTASFTAPAGATVTTVTFMTANKTPVWTVAIYDGSTAVTSSGLQPEPATGATLASVTSAEAPSFNASKFTLTGLNASIVRASGDRVNVAP
jgi:hypothetical protein